MHVSNNRRRLQQRGANVQHHDRVARFSEGIVVGEDGAGVSNNLGGIEGLSILSGSAQLSDWSGDSKIVATCFPQSTHNTRLLSPDQQHADGQEPLHRLYVHTDIKQKIIKGSFTHMSPTSQSRQGSTRHPFQILFEPGPGVTSRHHPQAATLLILLLGSSLSFITSSDRIPQHFPG
jgi:hypothetical protein